MKDMHTCPCGKHENPGEIMWAGDDYIHVCVETPSYIWHEYRKREITAWGCRERLLSAYRETK